MRKFAGLILAATALAFAVPAIAQKYQAEYRLSTVVGRPFLGQGRRDLGEPGAGADQGPHQHQVVPRRFAGRGDQTREFTAIRQGVIDLASAPP